MVSISTGSSGGGGHYVVNNRAFSSYNGVWTVIQSTSVFETSLVYAESDGAYVEYDIYLEKGTYTLIWYGQKGTSNAIISVSLNGSEIESEDTYSTVSSNNNKFQKINIVVSSGGMKKLRFTANGKNANSSSYKINIHGFYTFYKTG